MVCEAQRVTGVVELREGRETLDFGEGHRTEPLKSRVCSLMSPRHSITPLLRIESFHSEVARLYEVVRKERLADAVTLLEIEAPAITGKARPGQFVIVRWDERAERVPLTISNWDAERGTITIIFQHAGRSTHELAAVEEGDAIRDVVGPLGRPTEIEQYGTVVCVGGGIGVAVLKPIAKAMKEAGNNVVSIIGARDKSLIILEDEMRAASDELYVTTDNGSYGRQGFVSHVLEELIKEGRRIDLVFAIGPVPMMRVVVELTRPYGLKTMVSLDSIMIDGTGMCGCCRVTVGGQTKFTCVDGPDFDGHQVDWDELVLRKKMYEEQERETLTMFHEGCTGGCRK
jgi:ferredoxin--NADP+ reductase